MRPAGANKGCVGGFGTCTLGIAYSVFDAVWLAIFCRCEIGPREG